MNRKRTYRSKIKCGECSKIIYSDYTMEHLTRHDKLLACFECLLLTGEAQYDFFEIYISDYCFCRYLLFSLFEVL